MFRPKRPRPTRAERLLRLFADGDWHATAELTRKIGHTFAGAVFALRRRGYDVERRPHPWRERQHQYRLAARPVR